MATKINCSSGSEIDCKIKKKQNLQVTPVKAIQAVKDNTLHGFGLCLTYIKGPVYYQ